MTSKPPVLGFKITEKASGDESISLGYSAEHAFANFVWDKAFEDSPPEQQFELAEAEKWMDAQIRRRQELRQKREDFTIEHSSPRYS